MLTWRARRGKGAPKYNRVVTSKTWSLFWGPFQELSKLWILLETPIPKLDPELAFSQPPKA